MKPVPEELQMCWGVIRCKVRKSLAERERFNSLKSKAKVTSVADETISNKDVMSRVD